MIALNHSSCVSKPIKFLILIKARGTTDIFPHSDHDGPLPWFHGKFSHCFGEISVRYWKKSGKDRNRKREIFKGKENY